MSIGSTACRKARSLTVGAKNAAQQAVLCEVVARHLESRLAQPVRRLPDLGGTALAHQALTTAWVDLYPETTGAALTSILKLPPDARPEVVFERVRMEYRNRFSLEWFEPLGFSDGFVMVVLARKAQSLGLKTLSDAARLHAWQIAGGQEFLTRPDGMSALMRAYDLRMRAGPKPLPPQAVYEALRTGTVDLAAGNASDGQLRSQEFQVLPDDRNGFPPNQVALVARTEALEKRPRAREVLAELSGRFTLEEVRALNERALQGGSPAALAREFLERLRAARQGPAAGEPAS